MFHSGEIVMNRTLISSKIFIVISSFIVNFLIFVPNTNAKKKTVSDDHSEHHHSNKNHKKNLDVHVHGEVKLSVVISDDKKEISLNLEAPMESILGFEHAPKSPEEKRLYEQAKKIWMQDFLQVMSIDQNFQCNINNVKFEHALEDSHGSIQAEANLQCKKVLQNAMMSVKLIKQFPKIKKIHMEILGQSAKTLTLKRPLEKISLN